MEYRFQKVPQAISGGKQHPILHPVYSHRRSSHLVKPTRLLQSCYIEKIYRYKKKVPSFIHWDTMHRENAP